MAPGASLRTPIGSEYIPILPTLRRWRYLLLMGQRNARDPRVGEYHNG